MEFFDNKRTQKIDIDIETELTPYDFPCPRRTTCLQRIIRDKDTLHIHQQSLIVIIKFLFNYYY